MPLACSLIAALAGCGDDAARDRGQTAVSLDAAQRFRGFPLYLPGLAVGHDALTYGGKDEIDNFRRGSGRRVLFYYGRCVRTPNATESSCTYPITVEEWPICDRYPASHSAVQERTWTRVGGAPVVIYRTDRTKFAGIDVFARGTTISIIADMPTSLRVAEHLRGINGSSRGRALTPYASGFAKGKPRICN